jgi:SAM-dependent methyltransferase
MTITSSDIETALRTVERAASQEPDYSDFLRHRARYASDALMLGALLDGTTMLEVGSYPGHFTALLACLNVPFESVDIEPRRLGRFGERFALEVHRCDIEREPLPFDDESLNCVLFNEIFEHLRVDPLYALSQVNRVLAPGGAMLLTTPNLYSVQQCLRFLSGRGIGDPLYEFKKLRTLGHMGHVREYSHGEMRRFLHYAGFAVEQLHYKHYYYGGGKRGLAKRIIFALAPARLRSFQVILARKVRDAPHLAPLP